MPRLGRRAFTAGSLSLAACSATPAPDAAPLEVPSSSSPPAPSAAFGPVVGLSGVGPVIYSWTVATQIEELERGSPLLSRSSSATLGVGFLFSLLAQHATGLAAEITRRMPNGRFGWFNAWATSRGFESEAYGDELLRIVLAPHALFMVVESSTLQQGRGVSFCDVAGGLVPEDVAAAAPERVAGIFFTHDTPTLRGCGGTGDYGGASPYREVYLGQEAAIASFSARSARVAADLAKYDAELLALGRRKYSSGEEVCSWSASVVTESWTTAPTSPVGRYLSSLAFPTGAYVPTRENLAAIRAALAAVPITLPGIGR